MNENNTQNNEITIPQSPTTKFITAIRKNVFNFLLIGLSLIYILNSFLDVVPTGYTWQDVLYDSALGLAMGFSIKDILRLNGIKSGLESKVFKDTESDFHKELNNIEDKIQYLDGYCDRENSYSKIQAQKIYLEKYGLSYKKYINKLYFKEDEKNKLTKKQLKAINKVEKIKITPINCEFIISDENSVSLKQRKNISIRNYKGKKRISSMISMIAISLIFGIYSVDLATDFSYSKLIWYCIQIAIWLLFGLFEYIDSNHWIKNDYRYNYLFKISHIKKFKSLLNKDTQWFIDYENKRNKELLKEKELEETQIETTY